MEIIILGCGSSSGVPAIACDCEVCKSGKIKNTRTRSSIIIDDGSTSLLVDTSPDLRHQALANNIKKVDAVFFTHPHADHINGVDDLKSFNFQQQSHINAYADQSTHDYITNNFKYIFMPKVISKNTILPILVANIFEYYQILTIGTFKLMPIKQVHGKIFSAGFRINNFAYSTDFNMIDTQAKSHLKNLDLWIIDCLCFKENNTHLNFTESMKLIEELRPKHAILTHMNHEIDYDKITQMIPENVSVAFDGMRIKI